MYDSDKYWECNFELEECDLTPDDFTGDGYRVEGKHGSADAESSEHGQGSDSAGVSIYAAATGDLDHLIALSAAGVDLGAADYDRRTALHLAASNGHLAIVRYLLAQAVSESTATRSLAGWLAARDRFGNTAADDAARGLHVELLQLLADAARM